MSKLAMGELEASVMEILWDHEDPLTPGQVHELLSLKRSLTYNTVMTILVRLWRKGRLERRQVGRAFTYWPCLSREEHAAARMGEALAATADRPGALSHFLDVLTPADQARLRQALEERP